MNAPLRHRCRNPRCRMKLPEPVENLHHAFCTRGCYESFYRSRCLVCEEPMRRKGRRQRFGSGHKTCEQEYRRFPRVYDLPKRETLPDPVSCGIDARSAHFTGLKIGIEGDRPRHRSLRHWSWHSGERELELRDADGTLLARLESNAGRHRLTHPRTTPILSWPDLDEAKHRAESIAWMAMPLEATNPKLAADINRTNASPHPMGLPRNRQLSQETAIASDWRPTGDGADMPAIPDFLRRQPPASMKAKHGVAAE
jgi:hypothetical protein